MKLTGHAVPQRHLPGARGAARRRGRDQGQRRALYFFLSRRTRARASRALQQDRMEKASEFKDRLTLYEILQGIVGSSALLVSSVDDTLSTLYP